MNPVNPVKTRLVVIVDSVLEWLGLARRARPEEPVSPQQLRAALAEMLANPQVRRLIFQDLAGTVFPIEGGACTISPSEIQAGAFSCPGNWGFPGGNVGIGTAAPSANLEVRAAAPKILLTQTGSASSTLSFYRDVGPDLGTRWELYNDAADGDKLKVWGYGSIQPLTITTAGNVGIGTTAPSVRLHVYKGASLQSTPLPGTNLLIENNSANYLSFLNPNDKEAGIVFGNAAGAVDGFLTSQLNVGLRFGTSAAERMRISSDGKVGIGTTGPLTNLDVGGANRALGSDEHGIARIFSTSAYGKDKGGSLSFAGKYNTAGGYATFASMWGLKETSGDGQFTGYLAFATSPGGTPVERMRISSTGYVGIGIGDRLSRLSVKGKASFTAAGTVSTTAGSPTVSGNGTMFLREVGIGDRVTIGSETRSVSAIASDTSLTVDSNFANTNSGAAMTVFPSLFRLDDAAGNVALVVSDQGQHPKTESDCLSPPTRPRTER